LTKRAPEPAPEGEISDYVGYEKSDPAGTSSGNSRNGTRVKTVLSGHRTDVQRVIRQAYTIELLPGPLTIDLADPMLVGTTVRARGWYSPACSQDGSEDDDCPSPKVVSPGIFAVLAEGCGRRLEQV
jgi:hypothetical protein